MAATNTRAHPFFAQKHNIQMKFFLVKPEESFIQPKEEIIFYADDKDKEEEEKEDVLLFEDYNMREVPIENTRAARGRLRGIDCLQTNYNNLDQDPQGPWTLKSETTYNIEEIPNIVQNDFKGLIAAADSTLYAAKKAGRNRVLRYTEVKLAV